MLASLCFTLGYTIAGHHDVHDNIAPLSGLQWLLWTTCWLLSGLYAVVSWRRGGQTLGMRPWRLVVVGADGSAPSWRSEEHTSGLQSLKRLSYAVFCLKKKNTNNTQSTTAQH